MHFFGHPHPARAFAGRLPRHFYRHPHPARAFMRDTRIPRRQPPPHPRLRRSSPAPRGGQGQCVAISGEQPCLGRCLVCNRALVFSGISPCAGPWRYRHGGRGRRGGGTRSPSPVSHAPTTLLLAGIPCPRLLPAGSPHASAGLPHPARVGQSDTHDGSGRTVPERTSGVYSRQR